MFKLHRLKFSRPLFQCQWSSRKITSSPLYNFLDATKTNEDKPIFVFNDEECTQRDVYNKAMKYACYLQQAHGVSNGDHILSIARHCVGSSILPFAAALLNCTFIPVNHVHKKHEFEHVINLTKPKLICMEEHFSEENIELPMHYKIPIADYAQINGADDARYNEAGIDKAYVNEHFDTSHPLFILSTSGTTGMGKLVRSKATYDWFVKPEVMALMNTFLFPRGPPGSQLDACRTLCLSPPYHGPGVLLPICAVLLNETTILPFARGRQVQGIAQSIEASASAFVDALVRTKPNAVIGNTMWMYELYHALKSMTREDLAAYRQALVQHLHTFLVTGENIPVTLLQNLMRLIDDANVGIHNFYGSTEGGIFGMSEWVSTDQHGAADLEDKFYYFQIPDPELTGIHLKFNDKNELMVRSNTVNPETFEYLGNEKATAEAFDEEGFFLVGDECVIDEENNRFRFMQRRKDIIQTFGHIIYPEVIENVILKNEYVRNVVVVGIEYNVLYQNANQPNIEKPFAFVQVNDAFYRDAKQNKTDRETLKKKLLDLCERELNASINEVPESIHFITDIPMSSGIKKNRTELKKYFVEYYLPEILKSA